MYETAPINYGWRGSSDDHRGDEPAAGRGRLALQLLGGFSLTQDGELVSVSQPAEKLLAFLGLHPTQLNRTYVFGHLWGTATEERASGRLRTALWQLRAVDPALVTSDRSRVGLGPKVAVDMREMERQSQALRCGSDAIDYDLSLFRSELLPGWYDEWVLVEQAQLRQLRLESLDTIASDSLARGEYGTAVRSALAATGIDPLRESSHRLAIRAYLAEGNRAEAIRQFDLCAELLNLELGLAPSRAMANLVQELRPRRS